MLPGGIRIENNKSCKSVLRLCYIFKIKMEASGTSLTRSLDRPDWALLLADLHQVAEYVSVTYHFIALIDILTQFFYIGILRLETAGKEVVDSEQDEYHHPERHNDKNGLQYRYCHVIQL